ncbi:MAG: S9 family peptidase [Deltaproteobacteria bacterium]|nr:S9 family peptidase [Deltaproteobacteria bacterium]
MRSWAVVVALALLASTGACRPTATGTTSVRSSSMNTMTPSKPMPLPASASLVSPERMATFPAPGWHVPRQLRFAPDGTLVTYLASEHGGPDMALHAFDTRTREHRVLVRASDLIQTERAMSREEELRRERQRTQIQGITSYAWAGRANVMVVPVADRVFVRRSDGTLVALASDGVVDPQLCSDGSKVAFARGRELWLAEVGGTERALTAGAPEGVTRGQSDFNMQEEFHEPSGLWWSPTCDRLAYLEVDERDVATVPILGFRKEADLQQLRYPRSGGQNPRVKLGVIDLEGRTTWVDLSSIPGIDASDAYLGRLGWSRDGKVIHLQMLSRDQRRLALVRVDAATGRARAILTHDDPAWTSMTELHPMEGGRLLVLWPHEGRQHAVLLDGDSGALVRRLTSGAFDVSRLVGTDRHGRALVVANRDEPLERALYAVAVEGGELVRLSQEAGVHGIEGGHLEHGFIDLHSAHDRPPQVVIFDGEARELGRVEVPRDPEIDGLRLRDPELVVVPAEGAAPPLHGALLRPRDARPGVRYPAIVVVYGGPGVQSVLDEYNPRLLWQHLADRGFVVFQVDNRGASGHGHAFETPIQGRLGEVELADQLRALAWLTARPDVDPDRVGLYGHSYGGYMTLTAMLRAPSRYRVGIAGSPVTDWSLYDSGYTERYMQTPTTNPAGYAATSLAPHAKNLTGKLLVIHALMDENVHYEHTARITDALVAADRDFDLLVFPGERHGYRSTAARRYVYRKVVDYFVDHL